MKNKMKLALILLFFVFAHSSMAQFKFEIDGIAQEDFKTDEPKAKIPAGTKVMLNEIILKDASTIKYKVTINDHKYEISKEGI